MSEWLNELKEDFILCFVEGDRWKWVVEGLGNTLIITIFALIMGVIIGLLVAAVRSTYDKNGEDMKRRGGFGYYILKFFNTICTIYLTVIRGTPVVVQIMMIYFVFMKSCNNAVLVAIIGFGINSGAYVAEIFRGGIMSVDNGQFEAGRSLGFNYIQTMSHIIIPQAFKNSLPTLCNEFIVLLKETSIAGIIGVRELTKAAELIRGRVFLAFMPLLAVALIYLAMVMVLARLVQMLERRLRRSER